MEKKFFRSLVIAGFFRNLALSFTGLIDCAVVGHYLDTEGLSAMKLAMPIYSLFALFSVVFSTGLSITISKDLTDSGIERANKDLCSAFSVMCVIGVLFMAAGIFIPGVFARLFAELSHDPLLILQTQQYLRPLLIMALPILLYDLLSAVVTLGGGTGYLKVASAVLFVVDVAGDLLTAYLDKGMTGISIASAASYTAAFIVILFYFLRKDNMFRLGFCLPDKKALTSILLSGLPISVTFVCNIIRPVTVNHLILNYGTLNGLAALSVQDSVRYMPEALCSGVSSASLILAGIFMAESDRKALREEKYIIMRWSFIGGTAAAVLLVLLADPLIWIFTDDPITHKLGVYALLFYLPGVPFISINTSISSMFQGLGERWRSVLYMLSNHLIVPLLFAWLLGRRFGDLGIYASFAAGEICLTLFLTTELLIKRGMKKTIIPSGLLHADVEADLKLNIHDPDEAVSASRQVNALCLEHGVNRRQAYLIALTAEELAMNSLEHGFDDHKEHHLELRLIISKESLILRLRDDGRLFDLTKRYKMINPDDPTRNIGLRIIFASADEVRYNSSMNLNNVFIRINRTSTSSDTDRT